MRRQTLKVLVLLTAFLGIAAASGLVIDATRHGEQSATDTPLASLGSGEALARAYDDWKAGIVKNGSDRELTLSLNYVKGLSTEFTRATGSTTVDLLDGNLTATVSGLPDDGTYDLWLVDNRAGSGASVMPEAGDRLIHVGALDNEQGRAGIESTLRPERLADFQLDLVVITRAGEDPVDGRLLVGSPSLFQRLYYNEQRTGVPMLEDDGGAGDAALWAAPLRALIPSPAYAQSLAATDRLEHLVARGQELFFNETFKGNGRTCGTCHPADNNLTIDAAFIATLPPKDPLFVAEFIPALNFEKNGGLRFEDPVLMRKFGLIVENLDGFDDLRRKFTMRGVPHTLGMSLSLNPRSDDGTTVPPVQRTGWSGDGAPGDGSLRQFAVGAVTQHFPLTTARVPNKDFRLPTERELDAMEAFQLSLGRQRELDLANLKMKNAKSSRGKDLFLNEGKCNLCHANAGANVSFIGDPTDPSSQVNSNFDTGVEALVDQPARQLRRFPIDGGFGTDPNGGFTNVPNSDGSFGNRTFNTPSVVEAADTAPFFHSNAISTVEGAVAFYNSDAFNNTTIAGAIGGIDLEPTQVEAVAAFLRVINAVENIRSSLDLNNRALGQLGPGRKTDISPLLSQSRAEIEDGIEVLGEVELHLGAVAHLKVAKRLIAKAIGTASRPKQEELIRAAVREQRAARALMVARG